MNDGVALIVAGGVLGLFTQFGLWRRLPGPAAFVLLAASGVVVGVGALLVQEGAGPGDWALTLIVLGCLTPLHGRLLFGPPGRRDSSMVAVGFAAAYKGRESMSEPAETTPVAMQTPARVGGGAPTDETGQRRRFRRPRSRQARVIIRKVGPWSVLKFSLLFYICIMVVILGALVILYAVLGAVGAIENVEKLVGKLFSDETFRIHGDWLFTRATTIGIAMVVLWTLINVFVAFLYNLISDIVGGIEVTLSERR